VEWLVIAEGFKRKWNFPNCLEAIDGNISDGGIIECTNFYEELQNTSMKIPQAEHSSSIRTNLPYVFIGDVVFSLREDFLTPYNERQIFSYQLPRAR
jgi:hypothetical protein